MLLLSLSQKYKYDYKESSSVQHDKRNVDVSHRTYLRELEVAQRQLLHHIVPQYIRAREQPTPSTRLLVGDGVRLELNLRVEHMLVRNVRRTRLQRRLDMRMVQDRASELQLGARGDLRLPVRDSRARESASGGLGAAQRERR